MAVSQFLPQFQFSARAETGHVIATKFQPGGRAETRHEISPSDWRYIRVGISRQQHT